jgi:plastocyanin
VAAAALVLFVLLALAPAASAADYGIAADPNGLSWSPSDLTVAPGDTVTFSRASGGIFEHNVHFNDTGTSCPPTPSAGAWSCPRTYAAVGDFAFVCDAHPGMTGTVHVRTGGEPDPDPDPSPSPGSGPGPDPGPSPSPGDPTDTLSPGVELGGAKTQRVVRQGGVVVKVETTEAATVTAGGTVNVPPPARLYRFRRTTRPTAAAGEMTLRLRLSRKALRAVRKGLTYRRRLTALVRVTATDAAGNRTVRSRRIALRR